MSYLGNHSRWKKAWIQKNITPSKYMRWSFMIIIEQVLAVTPHKAPTIRPPASHHENYPS